MRSYSRIIFSSLFIAMLPTVLSAQANICLFTTKDPQNFMAEVVRLQSEHQARQETLRDDWTAAILPVKYAITAASLQPLCIFGIDVVSHPAMKLVALRAPKTLMPAIEEALKRLDVPEPPVRSIELTGYILVVEQNPNPNQALMPVPMVLQPVLNQLKNVLPPGTVYVADTIVVRGLENQNLQVNAGHVMPIQSRSTTLEGRLAIKDGSPAVVRIDNLLVLSHDAKFSTSVDIPVGAQIVVGKAASVDQTLSVPRPIIFVISAKIEK